MIIPETGIQKRGYHSRQISNPEYTGSGRYHQAKRRTFDFSKDASNQLGERLLQVLNDATPGSIIKLPAREIEMPNLTIKKHFKIVG